MTDVYFAPELDKIETKVIYSDYLHSQIPCQESLVNIPITSGQTLTFAIPGTNVFNLAESFFEFSLQVPAQVSSVSPKFVWLMAGCIPFFRSVQFQPVNGQNLITDFYHHFSKMSLPYLTSLEELQSMDNQNMFFPSRTLKSNNLLPANGSPASTDYLEMQYAIQISGGKDCVPVDGACQWNVKLPLSLFAGTILAEKRDICFGQQVNIQLQLEDYNKWIWMNGSPINPAAAPVIALTDVTAGAGFQIQNMYLNLAVQQKPVLIEDALNEYKNGFIRHVTSAQKLYQLPITGAAQNINTPLINRGYGKYLKRIYVSPFAQVENLNASLDNCNQSYAAGPLTSVQNSRVITFQTMVNARQRQQRYIYASPIIQGINGGVATVGNAGDWARYHKFLSGSCYITSATLGLNWTFVDDFTQWCPRAYKSQDPIANRIEGLDLQLGDISYQFLSTNPSGNATYNWYIYVETLRELKVGPGLISIY